MLNYIIHVQLCQIIYLQLYKKKVVFNVQKRSS